MGNFNGLEIIELRYENEQRKREDAKLDGLSNEATERYINDYVCCGVHLELYDPFEDDNEYIEKSFNFSQLEKDFKEYLLPYFNNDNTSFPKEFRFDGSDMEFMKPGFGLKESDYT